MIVYLSYFKGNYYMAKVTIKRREDFEKAFKQFKIRCRRDGVLEEYRESRFFTKQSQKRNRRKKNVRNRSRPH
jgi:ribosomal protein S21